MGSIDFIKMKKIILMIFVGMFLIGLISSAVEITINMPLIQPNLTLTRVPNGGNYVAGNYTFGIFADASGDGSWAQGHADFAERTSNYSIATIELQDNDGVMFNWTNYTLIDDNATTMFLFQKKSLTWDDYAGSATGTTQYYIYKLIEVTDDKKIEKDKLKLDEKIVDLENQKNRLDEYYEACMTTCEEHNLLEDEIGENIHTICHIDCDSEKHYSNLFIEEEIKLKELEKDKLN